MSLVKNKYFFIGLLSLWVALIYSTTLKAPFYFDDVANILEAPAIHLQEISFNSLSKVLTGSLLRTRPVANLSFAFNYYFSGQYVIGYHLVNILIHLLCSVFVLLFFRETVVLADRKKDKAAVLWISFIGAILWSMHPTNVQSVTYIIQRMNSLAVMFYMAAVYFYIKGRTSTSKGGTWYFVGSFSAFLLAMGSKEIAITLPVLLLLYEWFFFQDCRLAWLKKRASYIGLGGVVLLFLVTLYSGASFFDAFSGQYAGRDFTLGERLLTQSRVVVHYLSLFFYPDISRFALEHDFLVSKNLVAPISTLLSLMLLAGTLTLAVITSFKHRLYSFCILCFFLTNLVESTFIPLEMVFEHRTYLPFIFLSLLVVSVSVDILPRREMVMTTWLLVALVMSFLTFQRNNDWREPLILWQKNVHITPNSSRAHNYYGMALGKEGRDYEAIAHFQKAISLKDDFYHAHNNIGAALYRLNRFEEAKKHLRIAEKGHVVNGKVYANLGMIYAAQKDFVKAHEYFSDALRIEPDSPGNLSNLGTLYAQTGQLQKALDLLRKSLKIRSDDSNSHSSLGNVFVLRKQPEKALFHYREAIRLDPDNADARFNLGVLHRRYPELAAR